MARDDKDTMAGVNGELPEDLRELAGRIESMPSDAPKGLEARVFEASVGELATGHHSGIAGRIGHARWIAPMAAAAALGLLAWAGASWLSPGNAVTPAPQIAQAEAFDEHVDDVLAYAGLFSDSSWDDALAEDADALEDAWEPTVESWSLDGELGAS
ncbi:MAG: hypothetical protein ACFCBV_11815 [Phycisphaerales bacterium]